MTPPAEPHSHPDPTAPRWPVVYEWTSLVLGMPVGVVLTGLIGTGLTWTLILVLLVACVLVRTLQQRASPR